MHIPMFSNAHSFHALSTNAGESIVTWWPALRTKILICTYGLYIHANLYVQYIRVPVDPFTVSKWDSTPSDKTTVQNSSQGGHAKCNHSNGKWGLGASSQAF